MGSILRSSALMMVAIPLSVGQIDPTQAWSKDKTPVLLVHLGLDTGGTLRWHGPAAQLRALADAIHQAVRTVDSVPHYDY